LSDGDPFEKKLNAHGVKKKIFGLLLLVNIGPENSGII